jgi:hypothetical protein
LHPHFARALVLCCGRRILRSQSGPHALANLKAKGAPMLRTASKWSLIGFVATYKSL